MSVIVRGKNANKPYTVRFWVDGKQRERSFRTRKEADDFKIKTDHDVRAQIFVDDRAGRLSFSEAATAWLDRKAVSPGTKPGYSSLLNAHINPVFGDRTLASVANDREAVQDLLTATMAHLSYSRRKMARQVIVDVLDEAVMAGRLSNHRIKGIELVNGGRKNEATDFVFPAYEQLTSLAEGLGSRRLAIWLMRGCGLRIQEALAVKKADFRDGGRTLRVYEQAKRNGVGTMPLKHRKAGQYRDIPVPGYLWLMVRDLPDGYLLMVNGKFPLYNSFLNGFKRHADMAGIPAGFTPHSLRHAFVSALLGRGVPITDVAQWVGHKDINVTYAIYGHLVPNAADRAVNVLDAEYAEWSAPA
jgi:integrase